MNKKTWFCLLLKVGRHTKAGLPPEGVPQNCLFSVDFSEFFVDFSCEITEKGLGARSTQKLVKIHNRTCKKLKNYEKVVNVRCYVNN